MKDINNILTWKNEFGLLPIRLKPKSKVESGFIMLNGGYEDFCLKTSIGEDNPESYFNIAWSSNTKNFVVLDESTVRIFNWRKDNPEIINRIKVTENLSKFYKYIVSNSYKTEKDVVPFIIDIFRQFRNYTQEKNNASEALNLLFVLLAGLEDDINSLAFEKWGLPEVVVPQNFDLYLDRLKKGIQNIKPEIDLIIRHSAGVLFQEAQREVILFDSQVDLWGAFSSKITNRKNLYSSIHYTPVYLARTIVENALRRINFNQTSIKVFDPACGSSEFLIELLKQLKENEYLGNIQIVGWDSSESAVNTSNFLLTYEKRTIWQDQLEFSINLVNDSLEEIWGKDFDLVLMNPPFVSWEHLNNESREVVKSVFNERLLGRPNQASAFFYKAVHSLKDDGIIGCVIPSTFLTLDSYSRLRLEILELIDFDLIGKLGNFVFEDALTDISIIVGHKPKNEDVPYILWTKNDKGIVPQALRDLRRMFSNGINKVVEKDYSIYQPTVFPLAKENWKPIPYIGVQKFYNILLRKNNMLTELVNIFDVKQGTLTGNNRVFKISSTFYHSLRENEKKYFRPVIDSFTIKGGILQVSNYIWFPYNADGLIINTEEDLKIKVPTYYDKVLKPNKVSVDERFGISKWWELTRPRTWQLSKNPKLFSTRFGNNNSYAYDSSGEFIIENGSALILRNDPNNVELSYFFLSFFCSPIYNELLSIFSRQLAGGQWYDLGNKYIKNIPIPNTNMPETKTIPAFSKLTEIGEYISKGNTPPKEVLEEILSKYFYPE